MSEDEIGEEVRKKGRKVTGLGWVGLMLTFGWKERLDGRRISQ